MAAAKELSGVATRLIAAPALPRATRDWLGRQAQTAGVGVIDGPARELVAAFDAALAVSGTVTLECALAGTPPVIVYAADPVTELVARALLAGRAHRASQSFARRARLSRARRSKARRPSAGTQRCEDCSTRPRGRPRGGAPPKARDRAKNAEPVSHGCRATEALYRSKLSDASERSHDDAASERQLLRGAVAVSVGLFALRLSVGEGIGFGDAEALYACYALHPQPAYLDHPGMIGWLAGIIGKGAAPEPRAAHMLTAGVAGLVPWLAAAAARAAGASREGALKTVIALTLCPVLAIGLFALTPDLLLARCSGSATLAFAALALRSTEQSFRALVFTLGAAISAAAACLSKASGVLLALSLCVALLGRSARSRLRTVAPWAGLLLFVVLVSPLVLWEVRHGYPMLVHRLISTQAGAGFSFRNAGALFGGQLLYITPPYLCGSGLVCFRDLHARRNEDAVSLLLFVACVVPGCFLALLCLWSRVAEPHWLAPAYLSLAVHYAKIRA